MVEEMLDRKPFDKTLQKKKKNDNKNKENSRKKYL